MGRQGISESFLRLDIFQLTEYGEMIVCNGYKCTLLENPFVFQIQFCPPEEHTQVDIEIIYHTNH